MDRGYGRISLDTQASGSIAKQRARIGAFAGQDMEWYADESVSGSKVPFNERPAGNRLLSDLQPGDRVLVTKIDRAARSVKDLLNLVEVIDEKQASIVFVDQNIDTSGPMGRFLLTLLGAIAELEAAIIAERRRESLEQFAIEGRHAIGRAPFGFESVPNPTGRGLVIRPHPIEGPVLRNAIERVLAGETQESVCEDIGMSKSGFARLLRNPRLAGMTPSGDGVVTIDGIPRVDPEAAILSMAEWVRLSEFMSGTKEWRRHDGIGAALACGVCFERLYFGHSKKNPEYSTYKCRRTKHKNGEPSASVIAANAEAYVEREFLRRFGDRPGVVVYMEGSDEARAEAVGLARIRLEEVRRRQDAAVTDEEEEALLVAYLEAKRALREAEAIPSETRLVTRPSGRTLGQEWEAADPASRTMMLKAIGQWVVQPGRLPIEEKIVLHERIVDPSSVMPELRPLELP
jgi:DNA invertase Pin-like site-specific DNA recombinase